MTRKKNISKTWQANLTEWPPKHTPVSTVYDVIDSKLESDFDFKNLKVESEEEMESDDRDITLKEIQSDVKLLEFALGLQEAHDQMVTKEKAKWADKKRKSTYSGNSDRSKWKWKLQGKRAEEADFHSVTKFFFSCQGSLEMDGYPFWTPVAPAISTTNCLEKDDTMMKWNLKCITLHTDFICTGNMILIFILQVMSEIPV